ncbi:MAG: hypothetical protein KBT66_09835 [Amphritea sp.]|nr:hypothetical protein [Amphritea sp.]MBQ0784519.1 hypothetical protein [Amphritea sp.]
MKKALILVAALTLVPTFVAAESFENAYLQARAMYGPGAVFEWNGKQYAAVHEEEAEADIAATAENARMMVDKAKAKNKEVAELGFEWKLTRGIIKDAESALTTGEYRKALDLAAQAKYHARMGIKQYHYAQSNWQLSVPQ